MPHLLVGMDYLGKEVLTNRFGQICEQYLREMGLLCEYIDKVLDLWVQHMKNGSKNIGFIFLFSVIKVNLALTYI